MSDTTSRNGSGTGTERAGSRRPVRDAAPVIGAAVPVMLVNATAFVGQFAWTHQHVPWHVPGQILFSATLESIAVYLAWHAHKAQLANDSAGRLQFSAYLFALVIGAMNYSHYALHWHPNALAVGLGLMSALSPWLWGIHSRRASRDQLMAQGLIEGHAIRLGANRVMWHPLRSMAVMSRSAWTGERDPKRAIADYEERHSSRRIPARDGSAAIPVPAQPAVPAIPAGTAAPEHPSRNGGVPFAPEHVPAGTAPAGTDDDRPWNVPLPGTVLNGATVNGNANLAAEATIINKGVPSEATVREVRKHLADLPAGSLPSARAVARLLGREDADRRLAKKLLEDRLAAEGSLAAPRAPGMIAAPAYSVPGGITANG